MGLGCHGCVTQFLVQLYILIVKFISLSIQLVDQFTGRCLQTHLFHDSVNIGLEHGQVCIGAVEIIVVADEETQIITSDKT